MQRLVLLGGSPRRAASTAPPLTSLRQALESHASDLLPSPALVEVGCNNSPEDLNHGFDVAAVISFSAGQSLTREAASSFALKFQHVYSTAADTQESHSTNVLSLLFSPTPSPHCTPATPSPPSSIRHFVAWKFRPDAAAGAVDTAVAGYLNLPRDLPYFSTLEVGPDASHSPSYSVCLYSTFHDARAQEAFVRDTRRIAFKEAFVKPHLASDGVLVFDFVPARA
jgi:hypothetical protein